jgi:hypothetical protein
MMVKTDIFCIKKLFYLIIAVKKTIRVLKNRDTIKIFITFKR